MIKSLSNRLKSIPGVSRYAEEYSKLDRVGEGTFGEVHKAVRRSTKEFVALKKIRMEVCDKEGRWERTDFPFTAVREIKLLKQLKHPNIISVIDMAVEAFGTHQNDKPEIYLVFPYMEGDLCGILDDPRVILDMGTIKAYMQQLLDGLHYLHYNNIIHRDLKSANILLNNRGELRIADFGLARQFEPVRRPEMTAVVVTRWYRAPELLLGIRRYTVAIDMWAFGCILAEMITRKPLFPGQDHTAGKDEVTGEIGQLKLIYEFCGAPTDPDLDEIMQGERELRSAAKMVDRVPYFSSRSLIQHLRSEFVKSSTKAERLEDRDNLIQLIDALLVHVPTRRPAAHECLKHAFFTTGVPITELCRIRPLPGDIHEVDARRRNGALGPSDAPAPRQAPPRNVNGPHQPLPPHQPPAHAHGYHSNPYASHGAQRAGGHPPLQAHANGSGSSGYRAADGYRDTRDKDRDRERDREYRRRSRSPADHYAYHPRNTSARSPPPPLPPPPPPSHGPQTAHMRPRGTSSHPPPRGYSRERGGYDGPGYHGGHDDHGARGSIGPRDRDRAPSVDRRAGPGPNLSLPPTPAAHHHPTPPRPAPGPLPVAHGPESISGLLDKYGVQPPASGGSAGAGMARDMSRSSTGGGYPSHGTGQRSRMSSAGDSRPLSASRPGSASHPSLPSKPPMPPLPLPPSAGGAGGSGPASARTSADRVAVGPPRNIGLPRAPSVTMTTSVSSGEGVWGGIGTANVGGSSEREREMPSSASVPVAEAPLANAPDRSHRDRPNPWASAVGVGANARRG